MSAKTKGVKYKGRPASPTAKVATVAGAVVPNKYGSVANILFTANNRINVTTERRHKR